MKKRILPLSEVYRHLEPGPVVLLSTHHKGKDNVMTMSWHTMLDFEPPLLGCVISNRDYTFQMIRSSKQCVINIPTVDIAKQVVGCGNVSGKDIDKFKKYHLTKSPASEVSAPLVEECYANFECKLVDSSLAMKYNFFVLEVLKAWHDPRQKNPSTLHHRGKGVFMVAGDVIKLRSRMK